MDEKDGIQIKNEIMADIILNIDDATNGMFAPTCDSYNGGVYIYANRIPSDAITIPTIIVWRANIWKGN